MWDAEASRTTPGDMGLTAVAGEPLPPGATSATMGHDMLVIAIDVGTSSARASLYDEAGRPVAGRAHAVAYTPVTTPDGGSEHDPRQLFDAVATCLDGVVHGHRAGDIGAVGVATFWHGLLGFDAGGHPVTPIYMWGDTRAVGEAKLLAAALDAEALRRRTGCHLHASYWPAKLRWLARARPRDLRRVARWGSFGEHLEQTLFGEAATSVSMASGTGLLDQDAVAWDPEALAAAGIDAATLFPLVDRTDGRRALRPEWRSRWPALHGVPFFPAVGDGAASNVGSDCTAPDRIALNVGTSAALRLVTEQAAPPPRGLWRYRVDRRRALVGGATSEGGNVAAWCRRLLALPDGDADLDARLAALAPDAHGLTVLPFLAGERSPGWDADRRAVVSGLRLDTTPLDVMRAALEAVALRLAVVYGLLEPAAAPAHRVVASGGALDHLPVWRRIVADAFGCPITWCTEEEATSRGAALLALEATGALPHFGAACAPLGETVEPDAAHHARYVEALGRQRRLYDGV